MIDTPDSEKHVVLAQIIAILAELIARAKNADGEWILRCCPVDDWVCCYWGRATPESPHTV